MVSPTVVGAGCRVFGAGLADDVLMDLVPFILIVTPGEQQKTIMSYKGYQYICNLCFYTTKVRLDIMDF